MPPSIKKVHTISPKSSNGSHHHHHSHGLSLPELERQYSQAIGKTDVEEVWFAGVHCGMSLRLYANHRRHADHGADVGGGSVPNGTRNSLARISLRWMIRECFRTNTGIMFHRSMFKQIGMDYTTVYPHIKERPPPIYQTLPPRPAPGTPDSMRAYSVPAPQIIIDDPTIVAYSDGGTFVNEEQEDLADALCPLYDQLKTHMYWWILEAFPQKLHYQSDEDDRWKRDFV